MQTFELKVNLVVQNGARATVLDTVTLVTVDTRKKATDLLQALKVQFAGGPVLEVLASLPIAVE